MEYKNLTSCQQEEQIIRPLNFSVKVNEKFEFISSSCVLIKPFKTYSVNLKVIETKSQLVLNNIDFDMCSNKPKFEVLKLSFVIFGIPIDLKCPVENEFIHCYNESKPMVTSQAFQKTVKFFIHPIVKLVIETKHDSGSSCNSIISNIKNKN